jgi:hypothetical protein
MTGNLAAADEHQIVFPAWMRVCSPDVVNAAVSAMRKEVEIAATKL